MRRRLKPLQDQLRRRRMSALAPDALRRRRRRLRDWDKWKNGFQRRCYQEAVFSYP